MYSLLIIFIMNMTWLIELFLTASVPIYLLIVFSQCMLHYTTDSLLSYPFLCRLNRCEFCLSRHQINKEARSEQAAFISVWDHWVQTDFNFPEMECTYEAGMNFHNFWTALLLHDKIPAIISTNFSGLWSEEMTSSGANWFLLAYWD